MGEKEKETNLFLFLPRSDGFCIKQSAKAEAFTV